MMTRSPRLRITCVLAIATLATLCCASVASGAPPANDDFVDATVVAEPSPPAPNVSMLLSQTTVEATAESGESAHAGFAADNSVWYTFTPTFRALYSFYICNTSAKLAVYTGTAVDSLTAVTSGSRPADCASTNSIEFEAEPGTTYHLAVDTSAETSFTFRLQLEQLAPLNDDFADAVPAPNPTVDVPTTLINQTTEVASAETGEPAHAGFAASRSVWYSFIPTDKATYSFYICNTSAKLAVYTGIAVDGLTTVASGFRPADCASTNSIEFEAEPGTTYHLAVDTFAATSFTFRLLRLPDADGDGLPDSDDDCPIQAGPPSNGGCPLLVLPPSTTPATPSPQTPLSPDTGQRAAALAKCKVNYKKSLKHKRAHNALTKLVRNRLKKRLRLCKNKAKKLPV